MMTIKTFSCVLYSDPSHAWAKVKRDVLVNLHIAEHVSAFSYQRGDYVYLEEDNDMSLLEQALNERGTRLVYKEKGTDNLSRIRSYERYEHV